MADNRRCSTDERGTRMALYELRTYTLHVGKMAEAVVTLF
jgi:hypothetical protein